VSTSQRAKSLRPVDFIGNYWTSVIAGGEGGIPNPAAEIDQIVQIVAV
jgi:hypothetical protein